MESSLKNNFMTFGALRRNTGTTAQFKRLPRPERLARSAEPVFIRKTLDDAAITVYQNGLILFTADGHSTVFAVDRCLLYSADGRSAGTAATLAEPDQLAVYDDMPWDIPIEAFGRQRIDHNSINCADSRVAFHLDDENIGNDPALRIPSVEAQIFDDTAQRDAAYRREKRIAVRRALAALTDRQREILRMFYREGMTQTAIASVLGIGQPAVSRHLSAIKKTFLKKCKEFLRE